MSENAWKIGPHGSTRKAGPFILVVDAPCDEWQWRAEIVGDACGMTYRVVVEEGPMMGFDASDYAQCRRLADEWARNVGKAMGEGS